MALTGKKKAFADAKLAGKSNKEAAIAAGYSEKTAAAAGARLVKDVNIAAYIAAAKEAPGRKGKTDDQAPTFNLSEAMQHSDPMAFLKAAMNDLKLDPRMRIDAAKAMLPYTHRKLGEEGKKDERQKAAENAAKGGSKFAPPPPPLRLVGK